MNNDELEQLQWEVKRQAEVITQLTQQREAAERACTEAQDKADHYLCSHVAYDTFQQDCAEARQIARQAGFVGVDTLQMSSLVRSLVGLIRTLGAEVEEQEAELEDIRKALEHGSDDTLWPPGLTMAQVVEQLKAAWTKYEEALRHVRGLFADTTEARHDAYEFLQGIPDEQ